MREDWVKFQVTNSAQVYVPYYHAIELHISTFNSIGSEETPFLPMMILLYSIIIFFPGLVIMYICLIGNNSNIK